MGIFENFKNIFKKQNDLDIKTTPANINFRGGVPLMNNLYTGLYSAGGVMIRQEYNYRHILNTYIRNSPEVLLILNTVITDMVSDGYKFIPVEKQGKKTNLKKAEEWTKKNFFKQELKSGLFDWLWAGNSVWWYKIDENSRKDKIKEFIKIHNIAHKEIDDMKITEDGIIYSDIDFPGIENKEIKEFYDEEFNELRTFKHVPWSTVSLLTDNISIIAYKQAVGASGPIVNESGQPIDGKYNYSGLIKRIWPSSQILHAKFMSWDGKPWGYSPTLASLPILSILIMLKDYAGRWFEQGGIPEILFMFKQAGINDTNLKRFEQMLQTYQKAYSKRGFYVGASTGDFEKIDLNSWNKDMEYRKLAIYCTSIIAAMFQVPLARVQSILGMEIKGSPSDVSDAAYWRTISEMQDTIETLLNSQLFEPSFGVKIKFNNSYIQDDIRREQMKMMKYDAWAKKLDILSRKGKTVKDEVLLEDLELDQEDIEELKIDMINGIIGNRQGFMNNQDLMGSNQQKSKDKTTEQLNKIEQEKIRNDLKELKEMILKINEAKKSIMNEKKEEIYDMMLKKFK